jgi:hypothetical protein
MLTRQDFAADHLAGLVGRARARPLLSEEQLDQSRTEALIA